MAHCTCVFQVATLITAQYTNSAHSFAKKFLALLARKTWKLSLHDRYLLVHKVFNPIPVEDFKRGDPSYDIRTCRD
jgi:hypothetical protein